MVENKEMDKEIAGKNEKKARMAVLIFLGKVKFTNKSTKQDKEDHWADKRERHEYAYVACVK